MNYITHVDTLSITVSIEYLRKIFCSNPARYWASFGRPDLHNDELRGVSRDLVKGEFAEWRTLSEALPDDFWHEIMADFLCDLTGFPYKVSHFGGGRNNFRNTAYFQGGFIAWGGNNRIRQSDGLMHSHPERVQVYFDATGSELLHRNNCLPHLHGVLSRYDVDGRITRCDIALDMMDGQLTIDQAEQAYLDGKFTGQGRPPKAKRFKELSETATGDTLNVGDRRNGKMMRIYEKGRQLGDAASPWVRAELELGKKDRELPLDILLELDRAFAESYPFAAEVLALFAESEVVGVDRLVKTARKKADICLRHLIRHAQVAYGKLIDVMARAGATPDRIVEALRVEGTPRRLSDHQESVFHNLVQAL